MDNRISISIENFGPIKGPHTIYLNQLMIFSGPSGVGKSYLAMLTHYVYRLVAHPHELLRFFENKKIDFDLLKRDATEERPLICKINTEDLSQWIDSRALAYMRNMLGNSNFQAKIHINFPNLPESLSFLYSRSVVMSDASTMDYLETLRLAEFNSGIHLPQSESWGGFPFAILVRRLLRNKYNLDVGRTFFMPPSRGSMINIPDSIRLRLIGSMNMYKTFLDDLAELKSSRPMDEGTDYTREASDILQNEILNGNIEVRENDIFYQIPETEIPISAAASSIKEITPFALMIQKGLLGMYSILFEEPESHLHPELQIKVADVIGYALQEGAHFQITTHSDYFMRHLNDLIRLNFLKENIDTDGYNTYCKENNFTHKITIDPHRVSAFYLKPTANGESVIEEQTLTNGIPFDSFQNIVDTQLLRSANLYEMVESTLQEKHNNEPIDI